PLPKKLEPLRFHNPPLALVKLPLAANETLPVIEPLLVTEPLPLLNEIATLLVVRPKSVEAIEWPALLETVAVWLLLALLMLTTGINGAPGAVTMPEFVIEIRPLAVAGLLEPLLAEMPTPAAAMLP